jgi:hypothetical protein
MVANFLVLPTGTSLLLSIPQHRFGFSGRALAVLEVAAIAVGRAKKDARVVLEVVVSSSPSWSRKRRRSRTPSSRSAPHRAQA